MSSELVKKMYRNILDFYDSLGEQFDVREDFDGLTIKEVLKGDITRFLMYLSASDGVIAANEVDAIHEYLDEPDISFTPESLSKFIDDYNIYSHDFETTVPSILRLTVKIDNEFEKTDSNAPSNISDTLCELFKAVGQDFMRVDGDIHGREVADWETYIKTLDDYIKANHHKYIK